MPTKKKSSSEIQEEIVRRAIANGQKVTDDEGNDVSNDDDFLQQYNIAKSDPNADSPDTLSSVIGEIGNTDPDTQALDSYAQGGDEKTSQETQKLRGLQARADKADIDTERTQLRNDREEAAYQNKLRQQNASGTQKQLQSINEKVATPVVSSAQNAIQKITTLPTVGSIGLLVGLLVLLLFIIVDVDGKGTTRLKQLWYMLQGRATLLGRKAIAKGSQAAGTVLPGNDMGGGTLKAPTDLSKLNVQKFEADNAKLQLDLVTGNLTNPNLDVAGTANAIGIANSLQSDVKSGNTKDAQNQFAQLQAQLNKLNNTTYNADYANIYRDTGF